MKTILRGKGSHQVGFGNEQFAGEVGPNEYDGRLAEAKEKEHWLECWSRWLYKTLKVTKKWLGYIYIYIVSICPRA